MTSPRAHDLIDIVSFTKAVDRKHFSCGKPELDHWLATQAGQQERTGNTRTFLALDNEDHRVIGYYATTTYRLGLDEAARAFGVGRRQYPVPAVLLARLAVDESCQGRGVGLHLLVHALHGIADASRSVGFEVVVVHATDADAVTFYARCGFTRFEDHALHLFMPIRNLLATVSASG